MICCAFFGVAQVNAQDAKACTKSTAAKSSCCAKTAAAAAKAASLDETIESRTCATSGKVSYVQKAVCPMTGAAKYTEVEYSAAQGKFVSVKAEAEAKKPACTKGDKKACTKGKAATKTKATKV